MASNEVEIKVTVDLSKADPVTINDQHINELIKTMLQHNHESGLRASAQHYAETGSVTGGLLMGINKLCKMFGKMYYKAAEVDNGKEELRMRLYITENLLTEIHAELDLSDKYFEQYKSYLKLYPDPIK